MRFCRKGISNCAACPLRDRQKVWSVHPDRSSIMLVGESPGEQEEAQGLPFVGPAGKTLNYALFKAKLMRSACWVTNLISCRPPGNDLSSDEGQEALKCCAPGLEAELQKAKNTGLRLIMPLGREPSFYFGVDLGINKSRGSVFLWQGLPVLPTFHPAYIVRGQWKEEITWVNDFVKGKELSQLKYKPPRESFILEPKYSDFDVFDHAPLVGVDIETTGLDPLCSELFVVGLSHDGEHGVSFPLLKQGSKPYWVNGKAKAILQSALDRPTMFQNALFDVYHLETHGYRVQNIAHDTLLLHHAIHPELPHTIGYIVSVYGKTPYWKDGVLNRVGSLSELPDEELRTYNLRDSVVLHQVLPGMLQDLKETGTEHIYYRISLPLIRPLLAMTSRGLLLDKPGLDRWKTQLKAELGKLLVCLQELTQVPGAFNFDSPDHLRLLIYGMKPPALLRALADFGKYQEPGCKLRKDTKKYQEICDKVIVLQQTQQLALPSSYKTRKKTDTGKLSTDQDALLKLRIAVVNRINLVGKFVKKRPQEIEVLQKTLDFLVLYNKFSETGKLLSTYTEYKTSSDGRVHPKFLIHGTKTGRLSSREPNCQNIPPQAKHIFVAPQGYVLLEADYSNLELRVLAHESQDKAMMNTFASGRNPHDDNTRDLFGIDKEHPNWKTIRRAAKVYIFGRNYGGSLKAIYDQVCKDVPEITLSFERFCEVDQKYRSLHPQYARWASETQAKVLKTRTLKNFMGRIRIFLGDDREVLKEGLNFPIQSGAADIINTATISLFAALPKDVFLVAQVHDALLLEVPLEKLKAIAKLVKKHMEQPFKLHGKRAIFPVELSSGASWGTLKPLEL